MKKRKIENGNRKIGLRKRKMKFHFIEYISLLKKHLILFE